jgi:hypothetical protein
LTICWLVLWAKKHPWDRYGSWASV